MPSELCSPPAELVPQRRTPRSHLSSGTGVAVGVGGVGIGGLVRMCFGLAGAAGGFVTIGFALLSERKMAAEFGCEIVMFAGFGLGGFGVGLANPFYFSDLRTRLSIVFFFALCIVFARDILQE